MSTVWILDSNSPFADCLALKLKENGLDVHKIQTDFTITRSPNAQQQNVVAIVNANLIKDERNNHRVNRTGMKLAKDMRISEQLLFHGGILILSFEPEENIKGCAFGDLLRTDACVYFQLPRIFSDIVGEITKLQNRTLSQAERLEITKKLNKDEIIKLLRGFNHSCQNLSFVLNSGIEGIYQASDIKEKLKNFTVLQKYTQADDVSKRVKEFEQISNKLMPLCALNIVNKFASIQSLLILAVEKYNKFLNIVSLQFEEKVENVIVLKGREIVRDLQEIEALIREIILYFQEELSNA